MEGILSKKESREESRRGPFNVDVRVLYILVRVMARHMSTGVKVLCFSAH